MTGSMQQRGQLFSIQSLIFISPPPVVVVSNVINNYLMVSVFRWPDPNTGIDHSTDYLVIVEVLAENTCQPRLC